MEACQSAFRRLQLRNMRGRQEGCVGPTRVVDAQDQRESTLVAGSTAGDWNRAENRQLVLPTVLCHMKGIWGKLTIEKAGEARRPLIVAMFPGTGSSPSVRRRSSRFPLEPTCCC